ncbi:MAG: peptidase M16 [Rhodospirillaceae bacterium]|nr:peptidase M16 [Rhodospirillaceae bacterium]|tara:strand:+ start:63742 stop:65088 length:1347 start_codon:yes stop_codon:yes gene_type:complete
MNKFFGESFQGFALVVALGFLCVLVNPARAIDIQEVRSPGGIKAWLVQDKSVPVLSLSFAFKTGGTAYDPKGREGLARMVAGLLDEGAGDLKSQDFQAQLQDTAARIRFSATTDKFRGSFRTLTANKEEAFRLLTLALNKPRFDAKPIERIRGQIIANLRRSAQDPDMIGSRAWYKAVFPTHPYGRPGDGTIGSVKNLAVDDLRGFMRRHLVRNSLFVAAAGDISPAELGKHLDQVFSRLPRSGVPGKISDMTPVSEGKIIVIDRKIPQSTVLFGHSGIKRDDPDWYIASVMNRILGGGGFSSRLMEEVREKRGLAYGVYSYLNPYDHSALYMGGVATANSRVADSLKVIRTEWKKMAEKGVTEKELVAAKTYINGSFPLRLNSTRRIAGLLLAVQINHLGIDYLKNRPKFINAVTVADIKRVAQKLLRSSALTVVVVGQPKGIKSTP